MRRSLFLGWAVMFLLLATIQSANAAPTGGVNVLGYTFDTLGIISLLLGTILPLLVAVVSRESWNATVKGIVLLALSGLAAVLTQWAQAIASGTSFIWQAVALSALLTFVTGIVTHNYVWKPGGLSTFVQRSVGNTDAQAASLGRHEADAVPAAPASIPPVPPQGG